MDSCFTQLPAIIAILWAGIDVIVAELTRGKYPTIITAKAQFIKSYLENISVSISKHHPLGIYWELKTSLAMLNARRDSDWPM